MGGRGVRESVKINVFAILLTFWSDFYYFHGDFWQSQNVDVYFFWGEGGFRKCMVCTLMKTCILYGVMEHVVLSYSRLEQIHY